MAEIQIAPALSFLLEEPSRYKVAWGGRGGAKSWGFARALLAMCFMRKTRILCTREVQKSIRDSVHRLISDQIEGLGLSSQFEVLRDEIRGPNGSQFLFAGLSDKTVDSIKSFEGVDVVWVEEAQGVSERSWAVLIPTIRAPGSEIWMSLNPDQDTDPTFKRFIKDPPPNAIVRRVLFSDNPWFPEVLKTEMEYLFKKDPDAAAHVWLGECRKATDAQIFRGRYRIEAFEPQDWWHGPYQGADWGFAQDPTALVRCYVDGRTLYIRSEAYGIGVEIDHLPALFDKLEGSRPILTRADNARPETISYMQRQGFNMMATEKWPGSVEDGVEFLRSYDSIVIHPDCIHMAEEARLYCYKTDRLTGDILPVIVDRNNHVCDALRYALTPIIRGYRNKLADRPTKPQDEFFGRGYGSSGGWMG